MEDAIRNFVEQGEAYRWSGVETKTYNAAESQSRGMSKQILFEADENLPSELRYFESEPGGHSALERHHHVHAVLVLRGSGSVMLGDHVRRIRAFDTVYVPPDTWHQFYADADSYLGFLCLVNCDRDRPERASESDIAGLNQIAAIRDVIRY